MLLKIILLLFVFPNFITAIPPNDKALFNDESPESRGHKKRRGGPCRGRSLPEGRTFFDWSLQYVDVNYNYNYNVNCGGGGGHGGAGGGGAQKPILSGVLQSIGNRPQGGGHPPNGGGLLGGNGINFIQSQFQGIFADGGQGLGSFFPQGGLGSLLPQGGLFNGQGVLSLFDNGLFNGIFSSSQSNSQSGTPTVPSRPITTPKPPGQDPDDIIYNDERPVHEDHDPVVPDSHYNRPAPIYRGQRPYQSLSKYPYKSNRYYSTYNRIRFT